MIRHLPTAFLDGRTEDGITPHGGRLRHRLARAAARVGELLLRWQELARDRRRLQELDERMLKDIGITRADALHEAGRPFWDVPAPHWPDRR